MPKHSMEISPSLQVQLDELQRIGYVSASAELTKYFWDNPELKVVYDKFGLGIVRKNNRTAKFSNYDFFGRNVLVYYYSLAKKEDFENFLGAMFRIRNPNPSLGLTIAYTEEIHDSGLHPQGCEHKRRAIPQKGGGVKRGTPNVHSRKNLTEKDLQKLREMFH